MSKIIVFVFINVCIWVLSSTLLFSAEGFDLGEIIVTGKKNLRFTDFYKIDITAKKIKQVNADNVGDALRFEPGIIYKTGRTKRENYITIRGMSQQHILVLLDGMPVNIPYEGTIDMGMLTANNVSSIKVSPFALAEYGAQAIGGAVNIISKKPQEKSEFDVELKYGENSQKSFEINAGQRFQDIYYQFSVFMKEQDSYRLSKNLEIPQVNYVDKDDRDNSDMTKKNLNLKVGYELSPDLEIAVTNNFFKHTWGVPLHLVLKLDKQMDVLRNWRFTKWERLNNSIIVKYNKNSYKFKFRIFRDKFDNVLDGTNMPYKNYSYMATKTKQFISTYDDVNWGSNLVLKRLYDCGEIGINVYFKEDSHKEQPSLTDVWSESKSRTYSVTLSNLYTLTNELILESGLSFDYMDKVYFKDGSETEIYPGDNFDIWSPSVGLKYDKNEVQYFLTIARKIKFPTLKNLYSRGVDDFAEGLPNLAPEKSTNYQAGFKTKLKDFLIQVTAFYYDFRDLIIFHNLTGNYYQLDEGKIYGTEFRVDKKIMDRIKINFSYTLLSTDHNDTHVPSTKIHYRPENDIKLNIILDYNNWELSLYNHYVGKQVCYIWLANGTNYEGKLEKYFLTDIGIKRKISKALSAKLFVSNLFDTSYDELYLYPGKGRHITLSCSATF